MIEGKVKTLRAVFLALCGLSAGNASAAAWAKVVDARTSRIFVDTASITRTGDIVSAWYRRDFSRSMLSEKKQPPYRYQSSKVLNYYNCSERTMAPAQWITYEGKEGRGKIMSNEKVISLEYGEIPPGDAGEAIFNFVCRYTPRH